MSGKKMAKTKRSEQFQQISMSQTQNDTSTVSHQVNVYKNGKKSHKKYCNWVNLLIFLQISIIVFLVFLVTKSDSSSIVSSIQSIENKGQNQQDQPAGSVQLIRPSNSSNNKKQQTESQYQKTRSQKQTTLRTKQKSQEQKDIDKSINQTSVSQQSPSSSESVPQVEIIQEVPIPQWPSSRNDYDVDNSYNLWDIQPQKKIQLLKKYRQLPIQLKPRPTDNYQQITYGYEKQMEDFMQQFQNTSQVIDWTSIELTEMQKVNLQLKFDKQLARHEERYLDFKQRYDAKFGGKEGMMDRDKKITFSQFMDRIDYYQFPGKNIKEVNSLYQRQKQYYEDKYKISEITTQLPICVISPTHNNQVNHRYAWYLESLIQQEYDNYRVVIIDDMSSDNTTNAIANHLKWRDFPKDKYTLIKNKKHRNALPNTEYGLRKYCNYGQIFMTVDGDDQLIGKQVFKLVNSIYQKQKLYFLYSNHMSWDTGLPQDLVPGIAKDYPLDVKQKGSYRTAYHAYSALRTAITDILLLTPARSLKDEKGAFYWTIGDNAMVFPALEMSCGRVEYIPQLLYWYTANTGVNDWRTARQYDYMRVKRHISYVQKHFHCIDHMFQMMQNAVKRSN